MQRTGVYSRFADAVLAAVMFGVLGCSDGAPPAPTPDSPAVAREPNPAPELAPKPAANAPATLPKPTSAQSSVDENANIVPPTTPVKESVRGNVGNTVPSTQATPSPGGSVRSREEVLALIDRVGRTPPDWFAATQLNYPETLELSWPPKPPGGWNNRKNVGQFVWDVINPNPARWREGVRLMHHLLNVNKDNPDTVRRVMNELGRMYHELLQDPARAAFWYRQAGVGQGSPFDRSKSGSHLAECYWRLGNRAMAVELLDSLPTTYAGIKLWGDLGETERCVRLARAAIPSAQFPAGLFIMIGDTYRLQGEYAQAIQAYEDALTESKKFGHARQNAFRLRAGASIAAIKAVETLDLSRIPNGAYRAASIGYEGPVQVEVRVANGRIEQVRVTQHKEKQFYSSIEDTPPKIIRQQGIKGVEATSGATITSEAIINATAKALADAMTN